jgi:hypothetical protein
MRPTKGNKMKKCLLGLLSIAAGILLCAGFASGADADGTWTGSLSTPEGDFTQVFKLKTEGTMLSGTMKSPDGRDVAIAEGKAAGNRISFSVTVESSGKRRTLTYSGVVAGDQIAFDVKLAGDEPKTFKETVHRL